ncbi:MAG TPA: YceI family protein [Balneolales bacterium]|nr:YceI family protein [Balneolales bacterium]
MTKMGKIIITLFIVLIAGMPTYTCIAQPIQNDRYSVQDGSKIWIEGTTTVTDFSCKSNQINGYGYLPEDSVETMSTSLPSTYNKTHVHVSMQVNTIDCGKKRMNKDMYNAMKAKNHPVIKYDLLNVNGFAPSDTSKNWFKVFTTGKLTLAGKTKVINMIVDGQLLPDGRFHVEGSKQIKMTTFGIDPPTPFWGLIKTKDQITVHFDLYVSNNSISNQHTD